MYSHMQSVSSTSDIKTSTFQAFNLSDTFSYVQRPAEEMEQFFVLQVQGTTDSPFG